MVLTTKQILVLAVLAVTPALAAPFPGQASECSKCQPRDVDEPLDARTTSLKVPEDTRSREIANMDKISKISKDGTADPSSKIPSINIPAGKSANVGVSNKHLEVPALDEHIKSESLPPVASTSRKSSGIINKVRRSLVEREIERLYQRWVDSTFEEMD